MAHANEQLAEALGTILAEHEAATTERLDALGEHFREEIRWRLAELPPPEPGRDGVDRVQVLPRHIGEAEPFDANEIAWHNGGLWQSVRKGVGDPSHDPAGWKCLVPGISAIETREDFTLREVVFGFRMSDGTLHECRTRMQPGHLPPDYEARGWGVIAGDIVRDGDFERQALCDHPDAPGDWSVREVRGRRGRDGKGLPGDPGRPGPGLVGLSLARTGGRLSIVPAFADPAVKAEPIPVDLLTEEPEEHRHIIATFAGAHRPGRTYARGDAVRHGGGLWLSLRPDNDTAPGADGPGALAWERMV